MSPAQTLTAIPGYTGNLTWLPARTILLTRHGSHAYGLNTPESDLDIKGVAIPPAEYLHGFERRFEQAESKDPDLVIYDVRKFISLAAQCNPGIIEILWSDDEDLLALSPLGQKLREHRVGFLSLKAKHTFSGYAMSQLHRINIHYKWLKNPPSAPPERTSFGLPAEVATTMRDQIGAALAMIQTEVATWDDLSWTDMDESSKIALKAQVAEYLARVQVTKEALFLSAGRQLGFEDNFLDLLQREKQYRAAKQEWDSYHTWLKTRNPKRAALEAKYGMDCKHAMHLVRLMRMCREILTTGVVQVKRPDREELLAIRNGAWTYDQLVEWAKGEDEALTALAKTSKVLPYGPNRVKLDALCRELVEAQLHLDGNLAP